MKYHLGLLIFAKNPVNLKIPKKKNWSLTIQAKKN